MLLHGSGTARKLLVGFGALVVIFAATAWFTLAGLSHIHRAIEQTKQDEKSKCTALELASAVRDQYAHQAHTIIIGDASHLPLYRQAHRRVLELTQELRDRARGPDELAAIAEIDDASARLDEIFSRHITPAVLRGDRAYVQDEHARAQLVVTDIQSAARRLVDRLDEEMNQERAGTELVVQRTHRGILALLTGAVLLALAVSVYIGRSIADPVARLSAGAQRVGAGDLDTRIAIDTDDEFGRLAGQFNAMAAAIKSHQAQLIQSEKLAGIGRLAAGVAHEINNPLGVILGYVKLLRKRTEPSVQEDLAVVEEEALRCKEIVQGLLDLSRPIQAGGERIELRALGDDVVSRLRDARLLDGVAVEVTGTAVAEGHPSKIRQVLTNLVRNAAEAAGAQGTVRVDLHEADGQATVAVRDSGPGLDAAAQARLFEPFFTTKERGTGLGLAISRAIARAHGGEVTAENATSGGAVFTLRLPRGSGEKR